MRIFHLAIAALLLPMLGSCALLKDSPGPEASVCGWIKEPMVFALWSRLAGQPEPQRATQFSNAQAITYEAKDGRLLRGYKLNSTAAESAVVGRLLVAPGNAMLSDRLLWSLTGFADAGIEVFIFDYRGYGNSQGKRRLRAMISDYRELAEHFAPANNVQRFFYGISFGGIVVLNAIGAGAEYDRVVIDSTPSRISPFGCPEQYDPVTNLPSDASRMLFVAGERDAVVPIQQSEELVNRARASGARAEVAAGYAHPFMDRDLETHQSRLALIRAFLLE